MANNDVNVSVNVSSNLRDIARDATAVNQQLNGAADNAERLSRATAQSRVASQTRTYQQATRNSQSTSDMLDNRMAKGITGATGAASRDFARQAQGLGGLVHLYATFAANIFAVSSAFNILKNAMDTDNMIRGLDQLGAASGRNLGSLSKDIVKLTEGGIALRDAMQATAQATAAGMSTENLKRLAVGAKNASQALGRDMTDSLQRLSRGITKLEPELLDELGIFVRVDKAAEDYAKSIGKSASSLTDFEKRTAFAQAALAQLDQKFGSIKLETNPYDKLLASLKDLLQTGAMAINTVIAPIASFLASNPSALAAAVGLVAVNLLQKAIPALTQWREGLKKAAEESKARAVDIYKGFAEFKKQEELARQTAAAAAGKLLPEHDANILAIERTSAAYDKLKAAMKSKAAADLQHLDLSSITAESFKELNKQQKSYETQLAKTAATETSRIAELKSKIDLIKEYRKELEANVKTQKALDNATPQSVGEKFGDKIGSYMRKFAAEQAIGATITDSIVSKAADTAKIKGMGTAIKELIADIKQAKSGNTLVLFDDDMTAHSLKNFGVIRATFTGLKGVMIIGLQGIATAASVAMSAFNIVGTAMGVVALLSTAFANNTKETERYNSSVDTLNDSFDGYLRTVKYYTENINLSAIFPTDKVQAYATALSELSNNLKNTVSNLEEADSSANWFDRHIDGWLTVIGKDLRTKAENSVSKSVSAALISSDTSAAAKTFSAKIAKELNIKNLTTESIKEALEKLPQEEVVKVLKNLTQAQTEYSKSTEVTAAILTESKNSIASISTAYDELLQSLSKQSPIEKFAHTFINSFVKINKAITDTGESLKAAFDITKDSKSSALFGISKSQSDSINEYAKQVAAIEQALESAKKAKVTGKGYGEDGKEKVLDYSEISKNNAEILRLETLLAAVKEAGNSLAKPLLEAVSAQNLQIAGKYLAQDLNSALAQASIALHKVSAAGLSGASATIATISISKEELSIRQQEIDALLSLQDAINRNTESNLTKTMMDTNSTADQKRDAGMEIGLRKRIKESINPMQEWVKQLENASPEARSILLSLEGWVKQLQSSRKAQIQLNGETAALKVQDLVANEQKRTEQKLYQLKLTEAQLVAEQQQLNSIKNITSVFSSSLLAAQVSNDLAIANTKALQEQETVQGRINTLEIQRRTANAETARQIDDTIAKSKEELFVIKEKLKAEEYRINTLAKIQSAEASNKEALSDLAIEEKAYSQETAIRKERLTYAEKELEIQKKLGLLTPLEAVAKEFAIKEEQLKIEEEAAIKSLEFAKQRLELEKQLSIIKLDLMEQEATARQLDAEKGALDAQKAGNTELMHKYDDLANAQIKNIDLIKDAKVKTEAHYKKAIEAIDGEIAKTKELFKIKRDTLALEKGYAEFDASGLGNLQTGLAEALKTAMTEGGAAGVKKLRATLVDTFKKPLQVNFNAMLNGIINNVLGSILSGKGIAGIAGSGGQGGLMGLLSAGKSAWDAFSGKTISDYGSLYGSITGTGSAGAGAFSAGFGGVDFVPMNAAEYNAYSAGSMANTAGQFIGYGQAVMSLADGKYGQAIGEAIGTYILPGVGTMVGSMLGGFVDSIFGGGGGPKSEARYVSGDDSVYQAAYGKPSDGSKGNKQMQDTINSFSESAANLLTSTSALYGVTADIGGRFGWISADPAGDAKTQLDLGLVSNSGVELYRRRTQYGGETENVGRDDKDLEAAIQKAISDSLIIGMSNLDGLPSVIETYLDEVAIKVKDYTLEQSQAIGAALSGKWLEDVINSMPAASTADEITASIMGFAKIASIKPAMDALGESFFAMGKNVVAVLGSVDAANNAMSTYYQNFYTDEERFTKSSDNFSKLWTSMTDNIDILAGKSIPKSKQEFRNLVDSIDTTTESGKDAWAMLVGLSPAFNDLQNAADSLGDSAQGAQGFIDNLSSNLLSTLKDGMSGNLTGQEVGIQVADQIKEGILDAVLSAQIDSIISSVTTQLIEPIITAITTGASVSAAVSAFSIDTVKDAATAALTAITELFSDQEFLDAIDTFAASMSLSFSQTSSATQILTANINKITKKYTDAQIKAYRDMANEAKRSGDAFRGFAESLREFADSLLLSDLSPLTPEEKYIEAKSALEEVYANVQSSDPKVVEAALGELQSASQDFLQASRDMYASSDMYTADFDWVQNILDTSITIADAQATVADEQLKVAQDMLKVLGDIYEVLSPEEQLANAQTEALKGVSDELVNGFFTLDTNFDGMLTQDELGALGLSTNKEIQDLYDKIADGDKTITLAEAIKNASEGTVYSVDSLAPLLEAIRKGVISTTDAVELLAEVNAANPTGTSTIPDSVVNNAAQTSAEKMATQVYNDLFGRVPDSSGLTYWAGKIEELGLNPTSASDIDTLTGYMIGGIKNATDTAAARSYIEGYVEAGFQEVLDRSADTAGLTYWTDKMMSGATNIGNLYNNIAWGAQPGTPDYTVAQQWLKDNPNYIGHYASGGIHEGGYRIVGEQGPELEATGPARLFSFEQTNRMLNRPNNDNDEALLEEIRKLNKKIDSLERTIAEGDAMNYEATERNTQSVSNSIKQSTSTSIHANTVRNRANIT